jgi:hypothetical protein
MLLALVAALNLALLACTWLYGAIATQPSTNSTLHSSHS